MVATAAIDAVAPPRFEGRVARGRATLVSPVRFADGCAMDGDASTLPPLLYSLALHEKKRYWRSIIQLASISRSERVLALGAPEHLQE